MMERISSLVAFGAGVLSFLSLCVLPDTRGEVAEKYNIRGIPTTIFIDEDGIIKQRKIGAFISTAEIENSLSKIMP